MYRATSVCLLGLALTLVVFGGGGCATIVAHGPDQVHFTSEPSGAAVRVDDVPVGVTPCVADVSRSAKKVEFCLAGYSPTTMSVDRHINGWLFGNIAFGGLIGITVDIVTGNHLRADSSMHATLQKPIVLGPPLPNPSQQGSVASPQPGNPWATHRVSLGDGGR